MAYVRQLWASRVFTVLLTLIVGVHAAGLYWPASWWVEHRSVKVPDTEIGTDFVLLADREVKRAHRAEWSVTLHKQGVNGRSWGVVCRGTGSSAYLPGNSLPDPLTFSWWSGEQCRPTLPGVYRVDSTWELQVWPLPKSVTVSSNLFVVKPHPTDDK